MNLMLLIAGGIILAVIVLCLAPIIIGGILFVAMLPIALAANILLWLSDLFKKKR